MTVARFDDITEYALWFDKEVTKKWKLTPYSPWAYRELMNYYLDMREIQPTPAIIKGDFSQVDKLYNPDILPV